MQAFEERESTRCLQEPSSGPCPWGVWFPVVPPSPHPSSAPGCHTNELPAMALIGLPGKAEVGRDGAQRCDLPSVTRTWEGEGEDQQQQEQGLGI